MNFSKSGIGYSVGIRGARIGKDAKGRRYSQISIPWWKHFEFVGRDLDQYGSGSR